MTTCAMVINVKVVAKARIEASSAVCPANIMARTCRSEGAAAGTK